MNSFGNVPAISPDHPFRYDAKLAEKIGAAG